MLFVCRFDSSQPMPQVPWPNRATGFVLGVISSVCPPLSSRVAGICSFQVFSSPLPVRWGWGPHFSMCSLCFQLLPGQNWEGPLQATAKFSPISFLIGRSREPWSTAGGAMVQLFCLSVSRRGFRSGTTSHLGTQFRKTFTLPNSWVRLCHWPRLQISKATGWDYCLGSAGGNSVHQDPSAGY